MTAANLAQALRACASGIYAAEAATGTFDWQSDCRVPSRTTPRPAMGRGTPVSSIDAMPWAPRQWRYFHSRRLVLHVQGGSYAQGSRNHSGSHRGGGGGKPAFTFGRATGTPRVECPGDGGSAIAGPGLGQQRSEEH